MTRVDLLTREYPPEIYGGAGVHVEYLARELRRADGVDDVRVHCFGSRRDEPGVVGYADPPGLAGSNAALRISGEGHVVQNILVEGALPREGYFAAIADWGLNNTVRFSTIRLDPLTPAHSAALAVTFPETSTNFYGNIIDAPAAVRLWFQGNGAFRSDYNLFAQPPRFVRAPDQTITYDEWQATGRDLHSVTGDPMFENPAAGDYRLRPDSPAIDAFAGAETLSSDFDRRPRPVGPALDLGAFEFDPGAHSAAADDGP